MRHRDYILVVDDHPLLRPLLAECLKIADYDIVEACSADEALGLLEAGEEFDLVMTDIEMPGSMNGIELANLIHRRWPDVALMLMSARTRPAAETLPAKAEFIRKPSRPQEVVRAVQSLIRLKTDSATSGARASMPLL